MAEPTLLERLGWLVDTIYFNIVSLITALVLLLFVYRAWRDPNSKKKKFQMIFAALLQMLMSLLRVVAS